MSEHEQDVDEILTVGELCAWFKVSKDWVYDEVEAGRLPYVRLGRRHLRFRRSELQQYIKTNAQPLSSPPELTQADGGFPE